MLSIEDWDRFAELLDKKLTSARTTGILGDAICEKLEANSFGHKVPGVPQTAAESGPRDRVTH